MTTYSNPRMSAVIENWPSGQLRTTTATFTIERHPTRGERACRVTVNPKTGVPSKPKRLTYATKARIVDGDDGRVYIAELTMYRSISVMRGTMDYVHETIFPEDLPDYPTVRALFD